jgi:hypothetical protein
MYFKKQSVCVDPESDECFAASADRGVVLAEILFVSCTRFDSRCFGDSKKAKFFFFFGLIWFFRFVCKALIASIIVVLVDGFSYNTIAPIASYPMTMWPTFPLFLGNAAFLYLIHSVILPTEQSMKHRHEYPRGFRCSWAAKYFKVGLISFSAQNKKLSMPRL